MDDTNNKDDKEEENLRTTLGISQETKKRFIDMKGKGRTADYFINSLLDLEEYYRSIDSGHRQFQR